jgi:hypothetical protein
MESLQIQLEFWRCTPMGVADGVLEKLVPIYETIGLENSKAFSMFYSELESSAATGKDYIAKIKDAEKNVEGHVLTIGDKHSRLCAAVLSTACAFSIQALKNTMVMHVLKAEMQKQEMRGSGLNPHKAEVLENIEKLTSEAWLHATQATHWLGILQGLTLKSQAAASRFSQLGLDARHAENRAMKAIIFEWCDKHMEDYKSMDKAAEAVAWKEIPMGFRTVRDWMTEWRKLRPAGKP